MRTLGSHRLDSEIIGARRDGALDPGAQQTLEHAEQRVLQIDTLGAITKGQRQTGGQGLFRADDNLESVYDRAATRQLYVLLYSGKAEGCSFQAFEDATGLRLTDGDGSLREDLPPITTFLNRLLPLTIAATPPASIASTNSARVAKGKSSPPHKPSRWA